MTTELSREMIIKRETRVKMKQTVKIEIEEWSSSKLLLLEGAIKHCHW